MTQPTFTNPPPVPDRGQPDDFNQKMNAFLAYFPTIRNEMAAAIPWLASAVSKATNITNANKWVSGSTYSPGVTVWSPSDFQVYRAKNTFTSSIDPKDDNANWELVGGFPASHIDDTKNPHRVTPAQIGALDLSGGTMTGALNLPAGGLNVGSGQLSVDALGRVKMPNQPAFLATQAASTSSGTVVFGSVGLNVGSGYNSANGRYTSQVTGNHLFLGNILVNTAGSAVKAGYIQFHKNGQKYGPQFYSSYNYTRDYEPIAAAVVCYTNPGDYVELKFFGAGGAQTYSGDYNVFSGHFIG